MAERVRRTVIVPNAGGIHARPSAAIVKLANGFRSAIEIENPAEGTRAAAKSLIDVMSLVAMQGTELVIEAEGEDAESAAQALVDLVRGGFPGMDA